MSQRLVDWGLWLATAACVVVGTLEWRHVRAVSELAAPALVATPAPIQPPSRDSLRAAARRVAATDPFRLARTPPTVVYAPTLENAPAAPPPSKPPRPPLAVAGIIGGPPWAALLDGVPGRSGSVVVHAGDTLGGLRVRTVRRTGVIVSAPDTTWQLTLKRPWP